MKAEEINRLQNVKTLLQAADTEGKMLFLM